MCPLDNLPDRGRVEIVTHARGHGHKVMDDHGPGGVYQPKGLVGPGQREGKLEVRGVAHVSELREVLLEPVIEPQLALLDELHDARHGDGLGAGIDVVHVLRGHGDRLFIVPVAHHVPVDQLMALRDLEVRPGYAVASFQAV